MALLPQVQSRFRHNYAHTLRVPRQIDEADTDRQRGDPENAQVLVAELGQFLGHAADKGRGQRIGQPLHNKHKSNRQKERAHRRSPINQLTGAADAAGAPDAGALPDAPAALLK